jgi:hypothetical protein
MSKYRLHEAKEPSLEWFSITLLHKARHGGGIHAQRQRISEFLNSSQSMGIGMQLILFTVQDVSC